MNRQRLLIILLAIAYLTGVGAFIFRAGIDNDDPYITFRYSWNFAHGNGLVYNTGERVAGSTTPLYSLVLGVMLACGLPMRAGVGVLAAIAYALIAIFSWRMFRKNGLPWGGVVLPVLLLGNPTLISLYGNETSLALGLAVAAFALYEEGRLKAAFIVAAILVGVRPDGALVGIVLALVSFEKDRRRLWPALAWAALAFLPLYAVFAIYYQSLVPHTLAVKMGQGHASDVAPFWKGTLDFAKQLFVHQALPTGILALAGIWLIVKRRWTPLPLFVLFYALAFCLINPPYYYWWYQYPYWLMRDAAVAWAIGWIAQKITTKYGLNHAAAAVLLIAVCFATLWPDRAKANQYRARYRAYMAAVETIKQAGINERRILLEEIGIIGYELPDWTVYDMAGLVHKKPYREMIGDNAPAIAVLRGNHKTYELGLSSGKTAHYKQLGFLDEDHFSCSVMKRE